MIRQHIIQVITIKVDELAEPIMINSINSGINFSSRCIFAFAFIDYSSSTSGWNNTKDIMWGSGHTVEYEGGSRVGGGHICY